jgi:hypothetical protein
MFAYPFPDSDQLAGRSDAERLSQWLLSFVRCVLGLLLSGFYGVVCLNAQSSLGESAQLPHSMPLFLPWHVVKHGGGLCAAENEKSAVIWLFGCLHGNGRMRAGPQQASTERIDRYLQFFRRVNPVAAPSAHYKGRSAGTAFTAVVIIPSARDLNSPATSTRHGGIEELQASTRKPLSAEQSKSPDHLPISMSMCEPDSCGTWSFHGQRGIGRWSTGPVADLTIELFDSNSVSVRREDTGDTQGLKGQYTGNRKGDHVEGKFTWTWPGHGQLSAGTVDWIATIRWKEAESELPTPSSMAMCEGAADGCTTWSFQGKLGEGRWASGTVGILTIEHFGAGSVSIRRVDATGIWPGLVALYTGTLEGDHIEGTMSWLWPGHGQVSIGTTAWSATIGSEQKQAGNISAKSIAEQPAGSSKSEGVAKSQPTPFKPSEAGARTGSDLSDQRGGKPSTPAKTSDVRNGSYYALVIGINQYAAPLPTLKTAVNDAQAVAKLLSERYGFQINLLLNENATRANILKALDQYRRSLAENDNLLIYYAGHGHSDSEADKAYWLPADAEPEATSNWIIADELTTDIRVQPARHVLIISDSCYSGGLTRDAGLDVRPDDRNVFLRKMLASRSRTLMASGGNEPVSDTGVGGHSVFANALLAALQKVDQDAFTAGDLFHNFIQQQVAGKSEQVPVYSLIRNSSHDEGDFVFTRRVKPGQSP